MLTDVSLIYPYQSIETFVPNWLEKNLTDLPPGLDTTLT